MTPWTALVVIVALVVFALMRGNRMRQDAEGDQARSASSAEMERELADLRARVEVLERILTDDRGRDRLAQEIEALRRE